MRSKVRGFDGNLCSSCLFNDYSLISFNISTHCRRNNVLMKWSVSFEIVAGLLFRRQLQDSPRPVPIALGTFRQLVGREMLRNEHPRHAAWKLRLPKGGQNIRLLFNGVRVFCLILPDPSLYLYVRMFLSFETLNVDSFQARDVRHGALHAPERAFGVWDGVSCHFEPQVLAGGKREVDQGRVHSVQDCNSRPGVERGWPWPRTRRREMRQRQGKLP